MNKETFINNYNEFNKPTTLAPKDEINIERLIDWITDHADYGDIIDLCTQLGVDEEWFDRFYHWTE